MDLSGYTALTEELGDQARFRSLGPFELKGIAAPVELSAAAPPG
jgi:class 3 adenylate cyclase